jgi:N-acyl-D-aspartate/D-glutamate deacylase
MPEPTLELVLADAEIHDGTGAPPQRGDVGISGGRIAAIGEPGSLRAPEMLRLGGKALSPGFIDVHTHDDRAVLSDPGMFCKLSQGVTTVVVGNCGISLAPIALPGPTPPPPLNLLGGAAHFRFARFADYAAAVDAARPAINVAALVGHGTLRVGTMRDLDRPANPDELAAMREKLREGLAAGAIGFSSGLFYAPNQGADRAEVAALAREAAAVGGVYATHMRNEADRVLDSLDETFATARDAAVPVIISHHKCAGPANWGRTVETLPRIAAAARAQPVGLDAYPYIAGSTVLKPELADGTIRITVTWSEPYPEHTGRELADVAREWGVSQREACERLSPGGAIYFQMHEDDVRRVLAFPATMIGSDGLPHDLRPHPRLWGTFPRVLGHYSRELGLFPLPEAIRKMTGLSAETFRLKGRGRIAEGCHADLVVFDPATVIDTATFERPEVPAEGIELVLVAGRIACRDGRATGERDGRFIRRQAAA